MGKKKQHIDQVVQFVTKLYPPTISTIRKCSGEKFQVGQLKEALRIQENHIRPWGGQVAHGVISRGVKIPKKCTPWKLPHLEIVHTGASGHRHHWMEKGCKTLPLPGENSHGLGNSSNFRRGNIIYTPGDSMWPFHPLVGGHLTIWKGDIIIPKRAKRIARHLLLNGGLKILGVFWPWESIAWTFSSQKVD